MSRVFYWAASFLLFAFASEVLALSAIQGSPCYDICNGDQATSSADIVCTDDDFTNSTKGETLSQCLTCLQTSSYGSGYMTDSILFLYYLSTIQQTCLSGKPAEPISDCSNDCTCMTTAFSTVGGRNFFQNPYTYCTTNNDAYEDEAAGCATCLQSQAGTVILGNVVHVGKVGCDTQPDVRSGELVDTSNDLFNAAALGSGNGSSASASATSNPTKSTTTGTATASNSAGTSSTATSTSAAASTTSASTSASASAPASSSSSAVASPTAASSDSSSNNADKKDENNGGHGLSRAAAAGIGIAAGLLGIAAIVLLALFARRRMVQKQNGGRAFKRMQDSPPMQQVQDRSATPPAAGVFVPPGVTPAAPAAAAACVAAAAVAAPKKSKSYRSVASKSMKSWKSEWYYAANPKHSEDLSALPQRGWD